MAPDFSRLTRSDRELLVLVCEALVTGHRLEVQRLEELEIGSAEWNEQIEVIRGLTRGSLAANERTC